MILVPETAESLARALGETHRRYTRRVNFREGWRGYLWQGRFASFVMDEAYLLTATRYVERNPVKAGLVERGEDWPWSSAKTHVTGRDDAVAQSGWLSELIANWVCTWSEYLAADSDDALSRSMRRCESTGRPLGETPFIEKLEAMLGRALLPQKPGRKPKPPRGAN